MNFTFPITRRPLRRPIGGHSEHVAYEMERSYYRSVCLLVAADVSKYRRSNGQVSELRKLNRLSNITTV